ncbi:DUF924 family protein [Enterococcus sp. LJL99]
MKAQEVINFWFEECEPSQWFQKNLEFDQEIKERFLEIHTKATKCETVGWRETIVGRLAEIIVLDQFSRNIYRNDPRSFTSDGMALILTQEAIATNQVNKLTVNQRAFLYMPLMHSESLVIHEKALQYFSENGLENYLEYEKRHQEIIARFGRYPHRNEILNRTSTKEEIAFLKEPNSSF